MHLIINALPLTEGGGPVGLRGYLLAWASLDLDLEITVLSGHPPVLEVARQSGFEAVAVAPKGGAIGRLLWQKHRLAKVIRRHKADVLMTTNLCVPGSPVPQLVHHRNLWTLFSTRLGDYRRHGFKRWMQGIEARKALRRAEAGAFISDYMRQRAVDICPENASRYHVVYNGLEEEVIADAEAGRSEWGGEPVICAVQAASPHKDNPTLLRALARLVEMAPEVNWRLEVAGPGDWSPHQQLAEQLGVAGRIEWKGRCERQEILSMYRRSLCLWFTSVFEGYGMPTIEAMAEGCPAVCVNATAIPEVVGQAAMVVEPQDAEAFARRTAALWHDPASREKWVREGHAQARKYRWADSAVKMYDILASLVR